MNAMTESGITKHRLTVDDYYRMAEVGVLAPDARVDGLVQISALGETCVDLSGLFDDDSDQSVS
jgi:hypothetical protein